MSKFESIDKNCILVILGFATFWLWTDTCLYTSGPIDACRVAGTSIASFQLIGLGTSALSALIAVTMPSHFVIWLNRPSVPLLVAGVIAVTTLGALFAESGWFLYAIVFVGGLAAGAFMFVWVRACAWTRVRHGVVVLVSGSIALGGAATCLVSLLPSPVGAVVAALMPLVASLAYRSAGAAPAGHGDAAVEADVFEPVAGLADIDSGSMGLTWRFVLALIVFSVATGAMQFIFAPSDPAAAAAIAQARTVSRYVVAFVVFAGTTLFSLKPYPIFLVGSFTMIAAFLILPFLTDSQGFIATVAVNGGYTCLELMVWTVLFETARRRKEDPVRIVGQGRLLMAAAAFVGVLVCTTLGHWGAVADGVGGIAANAVVYALTIVTVLVVDEPRSRGSWNLIEDSFHRKPEPVGVAGHIGIPERCRILADAHGLTPREYDVLVFLATGRSAPYIAGELDIATSTVNYHVRHIYEKLGVTSKQQTIDLVESTVALGGSE